MATNIGELPDELISHIFSFLSIRDTLMARLSSPKWLNLPDFRSVIDINAASVVGAKILNRRRYIHQEIQSKFVKTTNRFMQLWSGNRMTALIIKHGVDEEHFGEIEKWIAKAFSMKVECIEINVATANFQRFFTLPCTAIQREFKPHLKQLCLVRCKPSFLNFGYTNWLSKLTTLRLQFVPLDPERISLIESSATNLVELELIRCVLGEFRIDGQLLHLKRLEISGDFIRVSLNCPSLEVYDHDGTPASLKFVHVPVLRQAKICLRGTDICYMFNDINAEAPSLEELSITIDTEIRPVPRNLLGRHTRLKNLNVELKGEFDLLSIKYLLKACPSLEELGLQLLYGNPKIVTIGRREQTKHHKLRKLKIEPVGEHWNAVKVAKYVVRNAMGLQEIELVTSSKFHDMIYYPSLRTLMEKVNPTLHFVYSARF